MANKNVGELDTANPITAALYDDLLYLGRDPAGTPLDRALSVANFRGYADVRDYGAVGDDSTDNAAAFAVAFASGLEVKGVSGDIYRIASDVSIPDSFDFDGNGCIIKPVGVARFVRNSPSADISTTISSGATQGSISVVVASATGLVIGQTVRITASGFPNLYVTIKNLVTTTVTIDHPLPFDYSGTITFSVYLDGTLGQKCHVRNVEIDGSLNTGAAASTGEAFRVGGFDDVLFQAVSFTGYDPAASVVLLQIFVCKDVRVLGCRAYNNEVKSSSNIIDIQDARLCIVNDNLIEGGGFGINVTRATQAIATGNVMSGRSTWELSQAVAYSVRGIKFTTVGTALISSNSIDDYESPIRIDAGFRSVITGNAIRNAGWQATDNGGIALNISASDSATQFGATITGNVIENSGGIAIGIDNGAASGVGKSIISNNYIRRCNSMGMWINDEDCIITDNIVEDWALDSAADGIHYTSGATVRGNRFHNTDNTRICMRTFLDGGFVYAFGDNAAPDGNPLFASSGVFESSGTATILTATTAIVVTHNLLTTPIASEIQLTAVENPTNTPGLLWVDTITATQFTINCENDPGASNLDVVWRSTIEMPFTQ